MKFINYLESIAGIGIYPLISLIIFFLFFAALFVWVLFMDKNMVNEMSELPLDEDHSANDRYLGI